MERNGPRSDVPGSNGAKDKAGNLEEVLDMFVTDRRLKGKDHEKPITLTEINQKLAPTEACKEPAEDRSQDNVGKQTKNTQYKQSTWITRAKRFCCEASVVGLRYVVDQSASSFRRSVWVLLLLAGAAFTTFQIQNRIRYFLTRPVTVSLRIQHTDEMRFPTVTICNENRFSYSAAASVGKISHQH